MTEQPDATAPPVRFGGDTRVTTAMEDYLKTAFLIDQDGLPVTNLRLADRLGFSNPSVTNMMKKLDELKLVVHNPYHGARLTPAGRAIALEVIRHHRLLELYLAEALDFDLDQVHAEAERLEHHMSETLEAHMERALGFPQFDPHGDPIPGRDGTLPEVVDVALLGAEPGCQHEVSRVSDRDPDTLSTLLEAGIKPGAVVSLDDVPNEDRSVKLSVGGESIELSWDVVKGIRVSQAVR
ncbi:MAG TPA: metal-dependent transcriptional regulator [Thermomicrobiales bacterium]|nr:metal-dependent transcriptional regulator [Thermomicrobiales bacterium]